MRDEKNRHVLTRHVNACQRRLFTFFLGCSSKPSSLAGTRLRSLTGRPASTFAPLEPPSSITVAAIWEPLPIHMIESKTSRTAVLQSSPHSDALPNHDNVTIKRGMPFFPSFRVFLQSILSVGASQTSFVLLIRPSGCKAPHQDHQAAANSSTSSISTSIHVRRVFIQALISFGRLFVIAGKFVPVACKTLVSVQFNRIAMPYSLDAESLQP